MLAPNIHVSPMSLPAKVLEELATQLIRHRPISLVVDHPTYETLRFGPRPPFSVVLFPSSPRAPIQVQHAAHAGAQRRAVDYVA